MGTKVIAVMVLLIVAGVAAACSTGSPAASPVEQSSVSVAQSNRAVIYAAPT